MPLLSLTEASVIGEVLKRLSHGSVVIEWTIPEFFSLKNRKDIFYCSPEFHFLGRSWDLEIWTEGTPLGWGKDWTGMRLWRKDKNKHSVQFSFGLKKANGVKEELTSNQSLYHDAKGSVIRKFIKWSDLRKRRSELTPGDALTIICTLYENESSSVEGDLSCAESQSDDLSVSNTSEDENAQLDTEGEYRGDEVSMSDSSEDENTQFDAKGQSVIPRERQIEDPKEGSSKQEDKRNSTKNQKLVPRVKQKGSVTDEVYRNENLAHLDAKGVAIQQEQMKAMLLKGRDHDVIFKVRRREFKAHKNILRARSPVLAEMFTHDKKKAESGDVTIECDPDAFGEFLEYIYVGKVQNLTPSKALGLYCAGKKYDLPHLKEMSVEFLKTSLSTSVICDVITMAMKHNEKELLDCAMAFFTNHLLEILVTDEWQLFLKYNPTLANELNVKAMKASYRKVK